MAKTKLHPIPTRDPISGGEFYVSELRCDESGVTLRGQFEVPRFATLDAEQMHFLETFLRCRGMISSVEKELGISYPTVRGRLDALLEALDLTPVKERESKDGKDEKKKDKGLDKKRAILDQLERGEITAEEAKTKLKGGIA